MTVIRPATRADALAMSRVLIASITELCVADHGNDPAKLGAWLANKTPEAVAAWLDTPSTRLFVADVDGALAAVGGLGAEREIGLNYVAPAYRFRGVSSALLWHLERALGPGEARLSSTATARRFYRARGWVEDGPAEQWRGMVSFPMRKQI